uniref:Uncharacterized protein n=1 Tax=Haptolina ericina TaxID=156174 RepID=A0A7S3FG58_9EUKA
MSLRRSAQGALSQSDVLAVYRRMLQESAAKKRQRIERLLGAPIDAIDEEVRARVAATGKSLGGKKELKLSRKELLRIFREVVRAGAGPVVAPVSTPDTGASDTAAPDTADAFRLFYELIGPAADGTGQEEAGGEDDDDEGDDGDEDAAASVGEPAEDDASILSELASSSGNGVGGGAAGGGLKPWQKGKPKKKSKGKDGGGGKWAWTSDVASYYAVEGGLEKLNREKPSTGFFGNGDVVEGMRMLSDGFDSAACTIAPFMGRLKPSGPSAAEFVKLSPTDDEATRGAQWTALRARFSQPGCALIFHLTNHYALLFALREWHEPLPVGEASVGSGGSGGAPCVRVVRQVLSTRRGQRPSVWIDFDEMRRTMLKWNGYRVLAVHRTL